MKAILAILIAFCATLSAMPRIAVTNGDDGGRFGDKLLTYLHAKWLSYQYGIPLFYKPFDCSRKLILHTEEIRLKDALKKRDYALLSLRQATIDLSSPGPQIYICPYFAEDPLEANLYRSFRFEVDWKDKKFRKNILKLVAPINKLDLIYPPKETINIALHFREGGGFDADSERLRVPSKLPPLSFYLESLDKVLSLFPNKPITCHVFTDALNIDPFIQQIRAVVPHGATVRFTYRSANGPDENVLDDFFSLFHFDCLIRPQSNFSIIPSLLHDFAVVCSPAEISISGSQVSVNRLSLQIDEPLYRKLLNKEPIAKLAFERKPPF